MTERLDMGRQDVDCRNIDVDNTDGRFADRQASSDYDEEYRDGCEDEALYEAAELEAGYEAERDFPGGRDFLVEEDGIGVVEILLILVVLITLVIIFRERLTELLSTIFESINSKSATVMQ